MDIDTSKWSGYYVVALESDGRLRGVCYPRARTVWDFMHAEDINWEFSAIREGWSNEAAARSTLRGAYYADDILVPADELRALISMELARQALDG